MYEQCSSADYYQYSSEQYVVLKPLDASLPPMVFESCLDLSRCFKSKSRSGAWTLEQILVPLAGVPGLESLSMPWKEAQPKPSKNNMCLVIVVGGAPRPKVLKICEGVLCSS